MGSLPWGKEEAQPEPARSEAREVEKPTKEVTAPVDDPEWEVTTSDVSVPVRLHKSAAADPLRHLPPGSRVLGKRKGDWLKLHNQPGYIQIADPEQNLTFMKQINHSFVRIESGNCSSSGFAPIEDSATCEAALVAFTLDYQVPANTSVHYGEGGCTGTNTTWRLCCTSACPPDALARLAAVSTTHSPSVMALPSLYCWAMIRVKSYELAIMRSVYRDGLSIFACNEWSVFSDFPALLGGQDEVTAVPGPPAKFNKIWLNTDVLFRAWYKIFEVGTYKRHEWTVKVDPDAVYIPGRLREHMRWHNGWSNQLYVKNCPMFHSMQGPLEVFSFVAVKVLSSFAWRCFQVIDKNQFGEDQFLHHCMDFLGTQAIFDDGLLIDKYCGEQPEPCNQSWAAALHPFKSVEHYSKCMGETLGANKHVAQ